MQFTMVVLLGAVAEVGPIPQVRTARCSGLRLHILGCSTPHDQRETPRNCEPSPLVDGRR